jgi:hypothetical protein
LLVCPDGTIGSPVAGGAGAIRALVTQVLEAPARVPLMPGAPAPEPTQVQPCPKCGKVHAAPPSLPAALEIGQSAPEARLPNLEGNTVELKDFRGE